MFKTNGWKVDNVTLGNGTPIGSAVEIQSDFFCITRDGRVAFAQLSQTDFTGIEVQRKVLFPQGVSIQEPMPVNGYLDPVGSFANGTKSGLGAEATCIDIWSSKELRQDDFDKIANNQAVYTGYTQVLPGFLNHIDQGPDKDPYWDQEQVYYGRTRWFAPSANFDDAGKRAEPEVRKFQFSMISDQTWGLMEPMAVSTLHHARIWIVSVPLNNSTPGEFTIAQNANYFYTLPPSNQPMLTMAQDPGFVERMTLERRARDV
jgi:hypothetical protein